MEQMMELEELRLEQEYKSLGEEQERKHLEALRYATGSPLASDSPLGKSIMATEFTTLQNAIQSFMQCFLEHKKGVKKPYVDILSYYIETIYKGQLETFAGNITLATVSNMLNGALLKGGNPSLSTIALAIGREIYDTVKYDYFVYCTGATRKDVANLNEGLKDRKQDYNRRYYLDRYMSANGVAFPKIDKKAMQSLGAELVDLVIHTSNLFDVSGFDRGDNVILPSDTLLRGWDKNVEYLLSVAAKYPPMVVPPAPWIDYWKGAYKGILAGSQKLLRMHQRGTKFGKRYLKKLEQLNLEIPITAVNAIQNTPWKIHKKVYEVATHLMVSGGGRAGLPYTIIPPLPMILSSNPSKEEVKKYREVMTEYYKEETARKSNVIRARSMLSIAKRFMDYERFYFPCNMDFRGRIYPIPVFNFQGDDLTKGLIEFAQPTPLKKAEDLIWFYVAGANHAGVDKVSYDDRKAWVQENHENILKSADDPIGHTWWADQDEPFQFLQWCFEYARLQKFLEEHNGNPVGFSTGTVIAFDGTCSGLQHYSALLRDPVGGTAVNLVPQSKPNDIYRIVADKVNKRLEQDALNGTDDTEQQVKDDKNGNKTYIKLGTKSLSLIWLTYGVTRKVTKRSVMTLPYGSKQYGFSDQLLEDIIEPDRRAHKTQSVFHKNAKACASYLAQLIWDAVGTTVVSAREGMKWLQACSKIVAKREQVVSWSTPAGLLVQQHYAEQEKVSYFLRLTNKRIRLYLDNDTEEVNKQRQESGIAPNFIHSLDAAHLQRTVYSCVAQGITSYAMVHDSYGTSLGDAQQMFDAVRVEFFRMYTQFDPIATFQRHLEILAENKKLPDIPAKGNLDLSCVLDSKYIFS